MRPVQHRGVLYSIPAATDLLFTNWVHMASNGRSKNRFDQHLRAITLRERGFIRTAHLHHPNDCFLGVCNTHRCRRCRQVLAIPFFQMFGECQGTELFARATDFDWATEKSRLGCQRAPVHIALGALDCHLVIGIMVLKERPRVYPPQEGSVWFELQNKRAASCDTLTVVMVTESGD